MTMYTTGDIAKKCGVSVRTVQYYDNRGILTPSQLSEGGRRLYSQEDLEKMKIICFLREMDLPINTIGELLQEEHPEDVIEILLRQQQTVLEEEISQRREKLDMLTGMQQEMKHMEDFSLASIGDIASIMENRSKLREVRKKFLLAVIPLAVLQWGGLLLWIFTGIFWPFLLWALLMIPGTVLLFRYYYRRISYICPSCHRVFKPRKKEMFLAAHTAATRRLTCTCCGHRGFCVETYGGDQTPVTEE